MASSLNRLRQQAGQKNCTRPTPTRQFTLCNAGAIHRGHGTGFGRRLPLIDFVEKGGCCDAEISMIQSV